MAPFPHHSPKAGARDEILAPPQTPRAILQAYPGQFRGVSALTASFSITYFFQCCLSWITVEVDAANLGAVHVRCDRRQLASDPSALAKEASAKLPEMTGQLGART